MSGLQRMHIPKLRLWKIEGLRTGERIRKKLISGTLIIAMMLSFAACGSKEPEKTAVNVFAAASLSGVMAEFEAEFDKIFNS